MKGFTELDRIVAATPRLDIDRGANQNRIAMIIPISRDWDQAFSEGSWGSVWQQDEIQGTASKVVKEAPSPWRLMGKLGGLPSSRRRPLILL